MRNPYYAHALTLPTELLREILSHLQPNHSKSTLYASSLVNSSMYHLSREILFREVTVTYGICSEASTSPLNCATMVSTLISIHDLAGGGGTALRFFDFLQRFPHLRPYVRTLKLEFLEEGRCISPHHHVLSLGPILRLLRKLETLSFSKLEGTASDVYHHTQFHPRTVTNLLEAFLSLPFNLSHLDTRGFAIFPLCLVLQCPAGLKKLSFTRLDMVMPSGVFYQRLRVNSLDIGTCLPDFNSVIDVSVLRDLWISTLPEFSVTTATMQSIINGCKDTLESLEISTEWFKRGNTDGLPVYHQQLHEIAACFDIENHTALHRITLSVTFSLKDVEDPNDTEKQYDGFSALARSLRAGLLRAASITLSVRIQLVGTDPRSSLFHSPEKFVIPTMKMAFILHHFSVGKRVRLLLQELRHYKTPQESLVPLDKFWIPIFTSFEEDQLYFIDYVL
ncbi:hypothetical protein JR316_0007423 [Psilocybe cubensis]|uniref:Uncharacterized protein n=2 Tax=Psilocybe cubensis TaxID=181762 RepID=A0ACB8GZL6_PSICU|nr:hypothetical protein JR316_0007423 [Psilocybe cubensis]KAH9480822.1 hypothetical protein JR316_0007423 [Psilocybe cubensis]